MTPPPLERAKQLRFVFLLASLSGRRRDGAVRRFLDEFECRQSVGALRAGGPGTSYGWYAHQVDPALLEHAGISEMWSSLAREVWRKVRDREPLPKDIARMFRRWWIGQSDVLRRPMGGNHTWGSWLCSLARMDDLDAAAREFVGRCERGNAPRELITLAAAYASIRALYGEDLEGETLKQDIRSWATRSLTLLDKMGSEDMPRSLVRRLETARNHGLPNLLHEAVRLRRKKKTPVYRTFRLWLFLKHCQKLYRAIEGERG